MHDISARQAFLQQQERRQAVYAQQQQQYYDVDDDNDGTPPEVFPAMHAMSLGGAPTRSPYSSDMIAGRQPSSPFKSQLGWQSISGGTAAAAAGTASLASRYPSSLSSAATSTSLLHQHDNNYAGLSGVHAGSPRLQQTQLGLPAVICEQSPCSSSSSPAKKQRAAGSISSSTTSPGPSALAAPLLRAYSHTETPCTANSPASRLSSMFSSSGGGSSSRSGGGAQQSSAAAAAAVHRSPSYQGGYGFDAGHSSLMQQQQHPSSAMLDSSNSNDSGNMNGPFYIAPSSSNMKVSDSFGPTSASAGPPSPGNSMLPPAPPQYRTIHSGSSYQQQASHRAQNAGDVSMASTEHKINTSGHGRHNSYSQAVNPTSSATYVQPPRRSMEGLASAYPQSQSAQQQQQRWQQDLVNSANNTFPYANVYDPAAMTNNALNSSSSAGYAHMPPPPPVIRPSTASQITRKAQDTYEPVSIHSKSAMTKGSSTTSEFTKRKNWSQRIVEEMQDVLHVLSPDGVFLFASPSLLDLTGWSPEEVLGRSIKDFMDRDDIDPFIYEFERSMKTESPMTIYYRFISKDEKPVLFEVTGRPYYSTLQDASSGVVPDDMRFPNEDVDMSGARNRDNGGLDMDFTESPQRSPKRQAQQLPALQQSQLPLSNPNAVSPERGPCKAFFAMARPYPGKAGAMLDSFLELKMENEKLRQKLAEVYREIEGDTSLPSTYTGDGGSLSGSYESAMVLDGAHPGLGDRQISGFPSRHYSTGNALQYDGTNASLASDQYGSSLGGISTYLSQLSTSNSDKVPLEPSNARSRKTEAIDKREVLVSSSVMIPARGDTYGVLGIGVVAKPDRNSTTANAPTASGIAPANAELEDDKKKKPKKQRTEEGDFVCRDCGSTDSPEWRRGPHGPKTLCNACGLRWAKKNKMARQSISELPAAAV